MGYSGNRGGGAPTRPSPSAMQQQPFLTFPHFCMIGVVILVQVREFAIGPVINGSVQLACGKASRVTAEHTSKEKRCPLQAALQKNKPWQPRVESGTASVRVLARQ
jgi:hypothetical protein